MKRTLSRLLPFLPMLASVLISACGAPPDAPSESMAAASSTSPKALVFADLPGFDRELSNRLNRASAPVVITSADHITLRQMPTRLEKWLSVVDSSGGKIEVQAADASEPQTRSLGLIITLLGALRQIREAQRDLMYAEARNFDARILYRLDSKGDRVVERVEMIRRKPAP
jgi:hypothetical protein